MARAKARTTKPGQVGQAIPVRTERQRFEDFLKGFTFKWECVFDRQERVIAEEDPDDPGGVTKYGIDKSAPDWDDIAAQCRAEIESAVLVEAMVRNRDERFDTGHFSQRIEGVKRDNWQVAWAEAFLTSDGTSLAVARWNGSPDTGDLRVAFFIHSWDSGQPLKSSYGDIQCPMPAPMPERLAKLLAYVNTD